ncbi:MAG: hypothetical protein EPO64_03985 [Nitrospirae bacterium]|nr:MAG: hypothetical protein EPO64_03985 [Nitrospirota bacterium]
MDRKKIAVGAGTLVSLLISLQGCHLGPLPPTPDLGGTFIAHSADIQVDENTVAEIMSAFKRTEEAVRHRDLDGVMALYTEGYKHRGFTKDTIRTVWKNLFETHHDFSGSHIFTRIKVLPERTPKTVMITCTGSLWAVSNETGQRENIDSWYGEVHYLEYSDSGWRIAGHAWEVLMPKETRFAPPPHPFF